MSDTGRTANVAKQVAKQTPGMEQLNGNSGRAGLGRSVIPGGVRKFERRVFRPWWTRDGERHEAEHYSIRLAHDGRRETINLRTPDLREASRRAARFVAVLKVSGWSQAHADLAPEHARVVARRDSPSVGDWLRAAALVFKGRPRTFAGNAASFRRIVADIEGIEDPGRQRFNYATGGRQVWLARVESVRLGTITPQRIEGWRTSFVRKAGDSPLGIQRARRNSNSYIRQARGIFSRSILKSIDLTPPNPMPFEGVGFEDEGSHRYVARIHAGDLMARAQADLRDRDPQAWLAFILLLCAGLRRGELDSLCWAQIDARAACVRVLTHDFFAPKTKTSERDIPLAPSIAAELERFRLNATGLFVIESLHAPPPASARDRRYRCREVFNRLVAWLRCHGVKADKPLHELRKEFGSIVVAQADLFTASRMLGHANLDVTQRFYAEQRVRTVVDPLGKAGER